MDKASVSYTGDCGFKSRWEYASGLSLQDFYKSEEIDLT